MLTESFIYNPILIIWTTFDAFLDKKIINKVEKLFKLCCGTRTFEKIETKWDFSHMDLSKASPKLKKWKPWAVLNHHHQHPMSETPYQTNTLDGERAPE